MKDFTPKVRTDPKICHLPKHKGKTWEQVALEDPGYIQWLLDESGIVFDDATFAELEHWLEEVDWDLQNDVYFNFNDERDD